MLVKMKHPAALFFSVCAVVDFAFGCIKWHSVAIYCAVCPNYDLI